MAKGFFEALAGFFAPVPTVYPVEQDIIDLIGPVPEQAMSGRLGEISDEELNRRIEDARRNPGEHYPEGQWNLVSSTCVFALQFVPYPTVFPVDHGGGVSPIDPDATGDLLVIFQGNNNTAYTYPDVPRKVFWQMMESGSKGLFLHHILKPQYSVGSG